MFQTPILFIVFNRPETTAQVFEKIRSIRPSKLYVVADGPRSSVATDAQNCSEVRKIIANVDWDCDVQTRFNDENRGPEFTIKNGINWFFSEVEYGIILEDDCIPSTSFFTYCSLLLEKFKDDPEINIITGCNFFRKPISEKHHFFIGDFMFTWGWASWARVFRDFNWGSHYELADIRTKLKSVYKNEEYVNWMFHIIYWSYQKEGNWDVEFFLEGLMNGKKGITPACNLVSNIGSTGTHYQESNSKVLFLPAMEFEFEKGFAEKYTLMPEKIKQKLIDNFIKLNNPITFRDRLYFLKQRMKQLLRFRV